MQAVTGDSTDRFQGDVLSDAVIYDLGLVDSVTAQSHGRPGERTFKIVARSPRGHATVWMEKEQLYQVGISIKQFVAERPPISAPAPFVTEPAVGRPIEVEFKAGDMSLRHDPASDTFTLAASNVSDDDQAAGVQEGQYREEQAVEVLVNFSRAEADRLADTALEVVASGRKPCPLCGAPIDASEHFCVRRNGHHKQQD
ncbi:MAG: DUF3090 family protein [Dehalococcoidia bacterium]|nr:DUF3090 family protein [Dehalococcoidia bacterium]